MGKRASEMGKREGDVYVCMYVCVNLCTVHVYEGILVRVYVCVCACMYLPLYVCNSTRRQTLGS